MKVHVRRSKVMWIMAVAAIYITLGGSVFAQTANVIELAPTDTARAQKAWDALQKAQAQWNAVRDEMDVKYVRDTPCIASSSGVWPPSDNKFCIRNPKEGFDSGFEFSKDFKHIVPKPAPPQSGTLTIGGSHCSGNVCW